MSAGMDAQVRLGMIGSGFIAEHYMSGLRFVPGARVVASASRGGTRGADFARRHGIATAYASIAELCADPAVDVVIVALPNEFHLEAVRAAVAAGKGVLCTKPLGRNGAEAAEMLELVRGAGVFNGYLENEVFCPEVMRVQEMVASGALGRVLTMRAREGHSGPHADHFWQAESAGGGAFLDMGCHCIEAVRYVIGKDVPIRDVFAWGATLVHGARTTGEDNAIAILRFEDGRTATIEASWTAKGGIEVRNEVYCERGRIVHDLGATPIRAFLEEPVGYLAEKTDADTGWVYPIADEARVAGYDEQFRHFVECFATGTEPRETFEDGYIVNTIIDAAYRSMRSGRWEPVDAPVEALVGMGGGVAGHRRR
jgi:predicted dehydrogenase